MELETPTKLLRSAQRRARELAARKKQRDYEMYLHQLLALIDDGELEHPDDVDVWEP